MKRTLAFLASTPLLLGACSVLITRGPPAGHEQMVTISCGENPGGPALDILAILATISSVALANALDESSDHAQNATSRALVGTATVGVFALSAGIGIHRINKCSAAKRALTLRQATPPVVDRRMAHTVLVRRGIDTLKVGDQTQLIAQAFDSTGAELLPKAFAWSSSNDSIASVSPAGLVTARAGGTVVIAASADRIVGTASLVVVPAH